MADAIATSIETAIEARLKVAGMAMLEIGKSPDTIREPAIAVAVIGGTMKAREKKLSQDHRIVITVGASNIREDAERLRRKVLHGLVESIVGAISMQKFDLPIQPLAPGEWRETTSVDDLRAGVIMAEIEFASKSEIVLPHEDDAAADITEIVTSFHLGDGQGGTEPAPRVVSVETLESETAP